MQKAILPTDHSSSDAELVRRMVAGDVAALESMMRRHNQALYRVARSILKNEQDAEESVQDAYLKAYHNIRQFEGGAKLSTWLTRIVINEALIRRRKHQRRAAIFPMDADANLESLAVEDALMPNIVSGAMPANTEDGIYRAEVRHLIERNIDKLPDSYRCVFVLRALEELSVEEAAECLDIPEATVRTRYFRARSIMREAIAREIDLSYEDIFSFDGVRCDNIISGVLARLRNTNE